MQHPGSQTRHRVHLFRFEKAQGIGSCRCGWAVAKTPMTTARAQRLANRYGKARLGPEANDMLRKGVTFHPLTEDQAVKDWNHHIRNLPEKLEKGGRVYRSGPVQSRGQTSQCVAA